MIWIGVGLTDLCEDGKYDTVISFGMTNRRGSCDTGGASRLLTKIEKSLQTLLHKVGAA